MTREEQMMGLARSAELNSRTIDLSKKDVFMSAYIQGWQAADQHPQWIPVEDELPKENEFVIAYGMQGDYPNVELLIDIDRIVEYPNGTKTWECFDSVSHWMQIPTPPRKEE